MDNTNDQQEISEEFKDAWTTYLSGGIEALEEADMAIILFQMHHVDPTEYSVEQTRFMDLFSRSMQDNS